MGNLKDSVYRNELEERISKAFTPEIMEKIESYKKISKEKKILEVVRSEWGGSILSSVIPLDLEEEEIISLAIDIFRIVLESSRYPWKILEFYIDLSPLSYNVEMVDSLKIVIEWKGVKQ